MKKPKIIIVVAYSNNMVIGKNNQLPWKLPNDLAHFKRVTMGHPIIMGRKTWESIGRPLPGRPNIVISTNSQYVADGATTYNSLEQAIQDHSEYEAICVIGGQQLFDLALPMADQVIATEIHQDVDGDTFFPKLDTAIWVEQNRETQATENSLDYDFVYYQRR